MAEKGHLKKAFAQTACCLQNIKGKSTLTLAFLEFPLQLSCPRNTPHTNTQLQFPFLCSNKGCKDNASKTDKGEGKNFMPRNRSAVHIIPVSNIRLQYCQICHFYKLCCLAIAFATANNITCLHALGECQVPQPLPLLAKCSSWTLLFFMNAAAWGRAIVSHRVSLLLPSELGEHYWEKVMLPVMALSLPIGHNCLGACDTALTYKHWIHSLIQRPCASV